MDNLYNRIFACSCKYIFLTEYYSSTFCKWDCGIGFLFAFIGIIFLPDIIPVHFAANGIADDYGGKIQIFLFPILQVLITFLTGREKVKYCLTHSKTFLTDIQFNWMIDGVLLLVMFAEIWVIYASFA